MRFLVLAQMQLICALVFAQSNEEFTPETIHVFSQGSGYGQLGIDLTSPRDRDTVFSPAAIIADGENFYIIDNVNGRLVKSNTDFNRFESVEGVDNGLEILWIDSGVLVGGYNETGPQKYRNSFFLDRFSAKNSPTLFDLGDSLEPYEDYYLIARIGSLLLFQGQKSDFTAIVAYKSGNLLPGSVLPQNTLKEELKKVSGERYLWKNDSVLDHGQQVAKNPRAVFDFFKELPKFEPNLYSYLPDMRFLPLSNGNYLFTDVRQILTFSNDGQVLGIGSLPDSKEIYPTSRLTPAPDGYIYYLHSDFQDPKTTLYRFGPFPEIRLGYAGAWRNVNDNNVNIRVAPSTQSPVITKVNRGTPTRILGETSSFETIGGKISRWYQVRLWDRTEGWIFGAFLDKEEATI